MVRWWLLLALVWALLLPPLFTGGACTREFDVVGAGIEQNRPALWTPEGAHGYFTSGGWPVVSLSPEACRRSKPRFLQACDVGTLVYADVPVRNMVCRVYRDDAVRVRLHYDDRNRLRSYSVEMAPYKSLPLPGGWAIHWGR